LAGRARGLQLRALTCQRALFDLPEDAHYLNCAYMSPLARPVLEAGVRGLSRKVNPSSIGPEDFFAESGIVRERFARLVNASPERVALIPAASYGVATCANNIEVARGQNLVLTHEQFPGNVYAWRSLAQRTGADVRTVKPPTGAQRGEQWNARILEAIDSSTAVVALGHVHWTDGTRFDLEAIGARARQVGAALIVDATQSVGALPFDVARLQPDALIVAAYKWLLGPYAIGCAYYGPRFDDARPLEETWIARKDSEAFSGLVDYEDDYQPGAIRFDVGERSNFALMPMLKESLGLLLEWTPERISAYIAELSAPLFGRAQELGYGVEAEEWRAQHLFGLRAPEHIDIERVKERCAKRGVSISQRGNAIRVSPQVYNRPEDVDALADALVP